MTSLTALAQAGHTKAPPFNGLFYATAATIIPVLFLAIAVQGPMYASLIKAAAQADKRMDQPLAESAKIPRALAAIAIVAVYMTSTVLAMTIVTTGVIGEIEALASLYRQHTEGSGSDVLGATVFLTIAVALGPAVAALKVIFSTIRSDP